MRALRLLDANLECIAITAIATRKRKAEYEALGITQLLAKLCTPRTLVEAIDRELNGSEALPVNESTDWR